MGINVERVKQFFTEEFTAIKATGQIEIREFFRRSELVFQNAGFRENNTHGVPSVLIMRTDVMGDYIITTGFIREVRRNFPGARITLVVNPIVKQIAEFCPYVNEILTYDYAYTTNSIAKIFEQALEFCAEKLWQRHFSVAFSPQWGSDNLETLMVVYLSGAKNRYGFGQFPGDSWIGKANESIAALDDFLLTKKIITPRSILSEADKNFYLLKALGYTVADTSMELWFDDGDEFAAKKMLAAGNAHGRKIILGLGAGGKNRKYPTDKWLVALSEIVKDDVTLIIVGGKSEVADAMAVAKNLPPDKTINLAGMTTMRQTAALVTLSDMYIGNVTKPILTIYHEAKDKLTDVPGLSSEYTRFASWQAPAVALRPEKALDECATDHRIYGGCIRMNAHCIASVPPQEIIDGYKMLTEKLVFYAGNV